MNSSPHEPNARESIDSPEFQDWVCAQTGARDIDHIQCIETLWSGYGQIARFGLIDAKVPSVIIKFVQPPHPSEDGDHTSVPDRQHPRGWNTDRSHLRKLQSYEVESHWYRNWATHLDSPHLASSCRIAKCFAADSSGVAHRFVLEDLDQSGYALRHGSLADNATAFDAVVRWLASFHARFLPHSVDESFGSGLWPVGTYWHLNTRPDEWSVMPIDHPLRRWASEIDSALNRCPYQTLVHGDAKVANFCFSPMNQVAAVDFQYVGRGCGMKDLAYFVGSCLSDRQCEEREDAVLSTYFSCLREALKLRSGLAEQPRGESIDLDEVETLWRQLYPVAWADFNRFLIGWCPQHPKLTPYARRMSDRAIESLLLS